MDSVVCSSERSVRLDWRLDGLVKQNPSDEKGARSQLDHVNVKPKISLPAHFPSKFDAGSDQPAF